MGLTICMNRVWWLPEHTSMLAIILLSLDHQFTSKAVDYLLFMFITYNF